MVAHHEFNKDTYKEVLALADKVYASTRPTGASVAAISTPDSTDPSADTWPTPAQLEAMSPEVAAVYKAFRASRGRGGRGNGRGGRGGRGRGGGTSSSGGSSNPNTQNVKYSAENPKHSGPRHQDLPPFSSCRKHWLFGKGAHWCQEPTVCPWKNFVTQKN